MPITKIENKIFVIRGKNVILSYDLAALYGVTTKRLNEQIKRNNNRFPIEFMFQLSVEEVELLRSQIATTKLSMSRTLPYAFTEYGILMAANVLNSSKAIEASIWVIKAFVRMRELISTHKELADKIMELENKFGKHEEALISIIKTLKRLTTPEINSKPKIGFERKDIIG